MTPTNDAEKAFEYIVEAFLMNDYKSVWEKEVETIRTALAKSAKEDVCSDCGSPMMDVCSGLEKISREGCNPETKTKVDGLLEALKEISTKGRWRYFEGQLINRAEEALKHFNGEDKSK